MLTIREILEATGAKLIHGDIGSRIKGVSIDSRTIKPQELFIAIKGNNFDGHNFLLKAKSKSSCAAIVSKGKFKYPKDYNLIYVKDTLKALGDIARFHRKKFPIPVIAITGSCGKTTAKEMVSAILKTKYNVLSSKGTQNNQIGVPLDILKLNHRHQIAVLEFGTNHFGEIAYLCNVAQPTIGILTNIGEGHLEFFNCVGSVFKEKYSLVKFLKANNGKVIFNNDDKLLKKIRSKRGNLKTYTFGMTTKSNFRATGIKVKPDSLRFLLNNKTSFKLFTPALHNIYNALAAIVCARIFNISSKAIQDTLARFRFTNMRMDIEKIGRVLIINDAYNSNPLSLESALRTISSLNSGRRKILVCADMLELGKASCDLHFSLGERIPEYNVDVLITIGKLARYFAKGARSKESRNLQIFDFDSKSKAINKLLNIVAHYDIILIKGSRLMRLETVAERLRKSLSKE